MERDLAPDWILKQTLAVQQQAHNDWLKTKPELRPDDGGLTLTVLGCGTMGIAILSGILESHTTRNTNGVAQPQRLPTRFNACVRSAASAEKVRTALDKHNANLSIYRNENVKAVQQADAILLSCEPHAVEDVLREDGMVEALAGKTLISILGGFSQARLENILYGSDIEGVKKCTIVCAMPNTAAAVRESMTVIATPTIPLDEETDTLITWIFSQIGKVKHVSAANMNACAALCGSGPAFVALMAESMAAGAISMGLSREDAYVMAAQTMRGTTGMLLRGEHPATLRDKVTTPGGCTIAGLNVLEEGAVRGTVAKAVRAAVERLDQPSSSSSSS